MKRVCRNVRLRREAFIIQLILRFTAEKIPLSDEMCNMKIIRHLIHTRKRAGIAGIRKQFRVGGGSVDEDPFTSPRLVET